MVFVASTSLIGAIVKIYLHCMSGKIILRAHEVYIKQQHTVFKFGTNQLRLYTAPVKSLHTPSHSVESEIVSKLLTAAVDPGSVASKHVASLQLIRHVVNEIAFLFSTVSFHFPVDTEALSSF